MTKERHKGTLNLGRAINSREDPTPVRIELNDGGNGVRILELRMSNQDFVDALFGRGYCACEFSLFGVDLVGKARLVNHVLLDVASYAGDCIPEAMVKLAPLVDAGWSYDEDDLRNHHCFTHKPNDEGYVVKVRTWKFVDPDSDEAKEWEAAEAAKEAARSAERDAAKSRPKKKGRTS